MMTSSNGNIFRVTGPLCGEFTGYQWIPLTKASDASDVSLICALNKWLNTQLWGWWLEMPSRSLWCHCNVFMVFMVLCLAVVYVIIFVDWCGLLTHILQGCFSVSVPVKKLWMIWKNNIVSKSQEKAKSLSRMYNSWNVLYVALWKQHSLISDGLTLVTSYDLLHQVLLT